MSTKNTFYCMLALSFGLCSCSSDIFITHNGNMPSNDKIVLLQKGQNKAMVRQILGAPSSVNPLDNNTWIYMSSDVKRVAFFKPVELDRDVLTVKFDENDIVTSISRYSKEHGKEVAISEDATEFQKSDQGFFQEYFGGVGAYMPIQGTNKTNQ